MINVVVDANWLQHRLTIFDKHGEHWPMVNVFFNVLTVMFSMRLFPISSFRFLFLLKTVIGFSGNNP